MIQLIMTMLTIPSNDNTFCDTFVAYFVVIFRPTNA